MTTATAPGAVEEGIAELDLARRAEDFREAYQARDLGRLLALFADDAEVTVAPGTFRGKDEIRRLYEWDFRLSPTAVVRDAGIGVLVAGRTVVSERVISLTAEGVPYEEPAATILEFDDAGLIRRQRSYYDKLALMDQVASGLPGLKGRVFRRMTGFLVRTGSKGLEIPTS